MASTARLHPKPAFNSISITEFAWVAVLRWQRRPKWGQVGHLGALTFITFGSAGRAYRGARQKSTDDRTGSDRWRTVRKKCEAVQLMRAQVSKEPEAAF